MFERLRTLPATALILLCAAMVVVGCEDDEDASRYDAPADHTVSKDGARHLPGLNDPQANCVSCHGADLRGGDTSVSCFECHGEEW